MKYEVARDRIFSGHVIGWTHRGFGSWYDLKVQAVRAWTRSEYSHVGLACWWGSRLFALEAVLTGVRIFPLSRLRPFHHVPVPVVWTPEVEEWAVDQVGAPYSQWQAIKAGVGMLKAGEDSIWQCAEYVQAVLDVAGVKLPGDPTPSIIMDEALKAAGCLYPVE